METQEIQVIKSTDALSAVTSAEIDKQIATAHAYPRDFQVSMRNVRAIATMDDEVAESCYYHLERRGKDGKTTIIEGPSIRLAEIAAQNWGNLRIGTRVIGNDGKMVTVEAVVHDLESNVAISQQQVRSIRDRFGNPYNNDMQTMTINAAASIAMRNAITKVVPKSFLNKLVGECKQLVSGKADELPKRRQAMINAFAQIGVTYEMLLTKLGVSEIEDITMDMVANMIGTFNALKDGEVTIKDEFGDIKKQISATANAARKKADQLIAKVSNKKLEAEQRAQEQSGGMQMSEEDIEAAMEAEAVKINNSNNLFNQQ